MGSKGSGGELKDVIVDLVQPTGFHIGMGVPHDDVQKVSEAFSASLMTV